MERSTSPRVTSGVLSPQFRETSSVEDALLAAKRGDGIAWIGVADPATEELSWLGDAIGFDFPDLAANQGMVSEDNNRNDVDRSTRVGISQIGGVAHLVFRGIATSTSNAPNIEGELEVLASQTTVVVITRHFGVVNQPKSILKSISSQFSTMASPSSGNIVGLIVSVALDWYADLIDDVEQALSEIADEMIGQRNPDQLARLYELGKPLHGATLAIQPIAHHLERILRELGADMALTESRAWLVEEKRLESRIARLHAYFLATLQIYIGLAQDEANNLSDERNAITQKMSGYALLLAIPTIIFSIYGMNFKDILIEREAWGYPVIIAITAGLCGYVYWRLHRSGWV